MVGRLVHARSGGKVVAFVIRKADQLGALGVVDNKVRLHFGDSDVSHDLPLGPAREHSPLSLLRRLEVTRIAAVKVPSHHTDISHFSFGHLKVPSRASV